MLHVYRKTQNRLQREELLGNVDSVATTAEPFQKEREVAGNKKLLREDHFRKRKKNLHL